MPDSINPLRPASIEAALAKLSDCDDIACKGGIVAFITTTNGGSSMRYYAFKTISEPLADALAAEDAAVLPVSDKSALDILDAQIRDIIADNQTILGAQLRAFQFGSMIHDATY